MTISVIARDAAGKKSTWYCEPPAALSLEDDLIEMVREDVAKSIHDETKSKARCVLALVTNPNKK